MATAAETLAEVTSGVTEQNLDSYLELRCLASSILAIANGFAGNSGSVQDFYTSRWTEDDFTSLIDATEERVSHAVLVSMLAAQRGKVMGKSSALSNLMGYFKPPMNRFLLEADGMLEEIQPRTGGKIGGVEIAKMEDVRAGLLNSSKTELLAILGMNGSGKTKIVEAIDEFGQRLGVDVHLVKFPRRTGAIGKMIVSNLAGGETIDKSSLQLLFLADMFDFLATNNDEFPICIADRLPVYDGQIYSPDFTKLISLWAMEGINVPVTALIVDRHPFLCRIAVTSRGVKPRIFETDGKQMALQQVEFWRLLGLPGVSLVNVDVNDPQVEGKITWMRYYAILATAMMGVWGRSLVKLGMAKNLTTANGLVNDELARWFLEKVMHRDGSYRFGER